MLPLLILGFIAATAEGYALAGDMQNDTQLCYDLRATRPGNFRHGPPESTDPDNFLSITVRRDNNNPIDDIFDVVIELDNNVEDSFIGWAIHVREYGSENIGSNDTFPFGSVASYSGISEGWNCPIDVSNSTTVRNGIVHLNGNLNNGTNIRTIEFKWSHISSESSAPPNCAKVVATVMTAQGFWWHAEESDCFLHNDGAGGITEDCPAECDASPVLF